jgi:hypothetical protein
MNVASSMRPSWLRSGWLIKSLHKCGTRSGDCLWAHSSTISTVVKGRQFIVGLEIRSIAYTAAQNPNSHKTIRVPDRDCLVF